DLALAADLVARPHLAARVEVRAVDGLSAPARPAVADRAGRARVTIAARVTVIERLGETPEVGVARADAARAVEGGAVDLRPAAQPLVARRGRAAVAVVAGGVRERCGRLAGVRRMVALADDTPTRTMEAVGVDEELDTDAGPGVARQAVTV